MAINTEKPLAVIVGGGLAGCEAAWQCARLGCRVQLHEMRPGTRTGAHHTDQLAELVCSNSLGSSLPDRASGVLAGELSRLDSLLLACARAAAVPAGGALAVDREDFARRVTDALAQHPDIQIVRGEITEVPAGPVLLATGPLTSPRLAESLAALAGRAHLFFFDAIAPIVNMETVNMDIAFRASRHDRGATEEGDYINCPLTHEEYDRFVRELTQARRATLHAIDRPVEQGVTAGDPQYFEGCLPVEVIAARGHESLAFGPLRPIGLTDPRTGRRPYAVVQLRQDNLAGTAYNLVGFQTNLVQEEQSRVFRLIPGLEHAEFFRHGQMHRNTFIQSPELLAPTLQWRTRPELFLAGQLIGVEGYLGSIATGWLAGVNFARHLAGAELLAPPPATMLGALVRYVTSAAPADFQPMKANFGILPPLTEHVRGKRSRGARHAELARAALEEWIRAF